MVEYKCFRCGYVATQKCNLKNHLNRKNICKPILEDISIEEIKYIYKLETTPKQHPNDTQTTPKQHLNSTFLENETAPKRHPNDTQTTPKRHPNDTQTTPNFSTRECKYCKKSFTRKSGLIKHLNICIVKKEKELLINNQNEEMTKMKK